MKSKLVLTNDGSHSLFVKAINECYHSRHGAIVEAEHVFIKNGLLADAKKQLNILEIGFGTGLNTLLSAQKSNQKEIAINYHTIELYPVSKENYTQLNFSELIGQDNTELLKLHTTPWEKKCVIHPYFSLTKNKVSLDNYSTNTKFDIIYFDAFSPEKQPEMWTKKVFKKMYETLKEDGFLITYCAKGIIKRTLKAVGFEVIALDGPPGKRQMTKAIKKAAL